MKKYLAVLIALLFATGAFAQEAEKKAAEFKYGISGNVFGVTGKHDDYAEDYSRIRLRPKFAATNGNVSSVVTLEIQQQFGDDDNAADGTDDAGVGTDQKDVKIKHAYIAVNDAFVQGLSVLGGLNAAFFPLIIDNDVAMAQVAYDFGMGKATLTNMKLIEDDVADNSADDDEDEDDANAYMLDVNFKLGSVNLRPALTVLKAGDNATTAWKEANLTNLAVNFNGAFGAVDVDATAAYLTGDVNDKTEAKGYAVDCAVGFKANDMMKITLFGTYSTGDEDDPLTDDERTSYLEVMNDALGVPAGRLYLLQDGTHLGGAKAPYYEHTNAFGIMVFGFAADIKVDKFSATIQYGYASTAEDNAAGDGFLGHEVDLYGAYEVAPATSLFVEVGYIVAGDDSVGNGSLDDVAGKGADAYQVSYGISTSL